MARTTQPHSLTPDQQAEADRIYTTLITAADQHIRNLANQLATTTDATIFGENEFACRDIVQRVAATGIETALAGRKKGGTKGPAEAVSAAENRPASNAGRAKRS